TLTPALSLAATLTPDTYTLSLHDALPISAMPHYPAQEAISPMRAIDDAFVALVQANPSLRVRVGNPDELQSNRMGRTLALLKHRSEEHTSELQSRENLVCRLLLEKKKHNQ